MAQLMLTEEELLKIGFVKRRYPKDELNSEKEVFEIPTINGCIYYNPNDRSYRWYLKTVIGEFSSHLLLDIEKAAELFLLLSCLRVKFNLFI